MPEKRTKSLTHTTGGLPSDSSSWTCINSITAADDDYATSETPTITCSVSHSSPKNHLCPRGTYSESTFPPCTECPEDKPRTRTFGSTSEFDCFSLSNNLLTISQNGNKATIYNPTKLTWDILLEELDHSELHAPRDLIWVSDTRFLIANFFGHVVSEFDFLGNYVGVFAELAEPEGLAFIPASSTRGTPNMLAVTSLSSGDVYFFDLNEGLNNGNLQVEDATKSTVASEGWSTGYPVSLSYDEENEMMLASTWNNEIIRFCIPDFPCNTEKEGVLAQDDVYIEDVEVTNDGHFIASCSKDYGSFDVQYSICKCPFPDTVPDTPIFLNTCKKLYLPTSDQYDIGNGYWGPGGTTIDHAKNIIYVVDESYSRIYAFTLDTLR